LKFRAPFAPKLPMKSDYVYDSLFHDAA
jgi:hypothetical protein